MLEYLRNASNKPVAKVLMGLLIFSFVGWGVADWIFGATMRDNLVANVGGTDISMTEFNVARTREMAQLSASQQKQIYTDAEFANKFYIQVLSNLMNDVMVKNRANDLGFYITDRRIAAEIKSYPEFQEMGQFSPNKFYMTLMNNGFSEEQFADYLRDQTLRAYTLGAVSMPVKVSNFAVTATYNARYAQREIEFTTVKFSDFKVGNPTDTQLREFYAKNPKTIPESRKISYVLVSAKMQQPDSYESGFARAQKLEDAIISGESMQASAAKLGAKYVALPAFSVDKKPSDELMTDAIVSKVFAMDMGTESEIIETKNGFMILRVENVTAAHTADFDSVKNTLVSNWKKDEQKKQAYLRANDILVDLNKGLKPKNKTAVTISRTNGAPNDVLVAAFNQAIGTNAIVAANDTFYVLRVAKNIAPKIDTAKMAAVRQELSSMSLRNMMEDYNAFLVREYPAKINNKTMDKVLMK